MGQSLVDLCTQNPWATVAERERGARQKEEDQKDPEAIMLATNETMMLAT